MSRAHGNVSAKLRKAGSDPNVDDTEGTPGEHTWFGRGARGWVDLQCPYPRRAPDLRC
jgi:hypothetical protein